jgi:hypothetical protein
MQHAETERHYWASGAVRQSSSSAVGFPLLLFRRPLFEPIQASIRAATDAVIAQTTVHKSMTELRRYIGEGNLFNENVVSAVEL